MQIRVCSPVNVQKVKITEQHYVYRVVNSFREALKLTRGSVELLEGGGGGWGAVKAPSVNDLFKEKFWDILIIIQLCPKILLYLHV